MANGESYERILDRIEEAILRVEEKIDSVNRKVESINNVGCAQRPNDIRRIDNLEKWRDKGVAGIVVLAVGVILNFFGIKPH